MKAIFSEYCVKYRFLITSDKISNNDIAFVQKLINETATLDDIINSLKKLSRILSEYYNKPVIILIDEYDVPISCAKENGYYKEMISVIRSMFSIALKSSSHLKFAVLSGCLRIAKESIFTDTNNFTSYSILDDEFSQYFGFTETEVNKLLADCGFDDKAHMIKEWYDGYMFGNTEVYCPWDVINYIAALQNNPDKNPQNYWINTSHNGIVRSFVNHTEYGVNEKFETLLHGGTVTQKITDNLTYDLLHNSEDNLWSVLYMTGYLTKVNNEHTNDEVELKIPNKEIESIFRDTVIEWFNDSIDKCTQQELMTALWNGDELHATQLLSDFLWNTISYNDYHEDYYHAFLVGMFKCIGYTVESNKEYGLGRPDIVLKDRKNRQAIIIETKRSKTESAMPDSCDKAIYQIKNNCYAQGIPNGYRKILCYGIAFFQKSCLVKLMKE